MYKKLFNHPSPAGEITLVRLENAGGSWVELSSLGAGVTALCVPDRNGRIRNVALGYADPASYLADGPCMGKTPGRYANRIAGGHFQLDGKEFQLPVNLPPNHLHGGPEGFQNRIWETEVTEDGVLFTLRSADGDMGYPGELTVHVRYRWSDDCVLSIEFEATTTAPTIVNLTNHTYWNLRGADEGDALDHNLRVNASRFLETDANLTPTGNFIEVEGTPMDFRREKEVRHDIHADYTPLKNGGGYDHCWAVDAWEEGKIKEDVVLTDFVSGRRLTVSSDQPGVQVYTGNWLSGSPENRSGRGYENFEGIAIEAQGFPDAPNHPGFPSQRLNPGETYRRHIRYAFTTV